MSAANGHDDRRRRQELEMATTERSVGSNGNGLEPIEGDRGATILGPRNVPVDRRIRVSCVAGHRLGHHPESEVSFAAARNRILTGGWARG